MPILLYAIMHCVLEGGEGIPLLLGAGARAAVRASAGIAGTPRGYISVVRSVVLDLT